MFDSAFFKIKSCTALWAKIFVVLGLLSSPGLAVPGQIFAHERFQDAIYLKNEDFRFGTYIIDKPGIYRLAEDIRFNPNSPASLTRALSNGDIPPAAAAALELPDPVDAYHAGFPYGQNGETGASETNMRPGSHRRGR